jgi:hypothetical protein
MRLIRIFALILAATPIAPARSQPVHHSGNVGIAADPECFRCRPPALLEPLAAVGCSLAARPVVLGSPIVTYGGYAVRPVYLVAPSAKIIHVYRDDD